MPCLYEYSSDSIELFTEIIAHQYGIPKRFGNVGGGKTKRGKE